MIRLWIVLGGTRGFCRRSATGLPAYETNRKLRNVESEQDGDAVEDPSDDVRKHRFPLSRRMEIGIRARPEASADPELLRC